MTTATATQRRRLLVRIRKKEGLLPFGFINLAGVSFRGQTKKYSDEEGGIDEVYEGVILNLDEDEVSAIQTDAELHVVRWFRNGRRAANPGQLNRSEVHHIQDKMFRAGPMDEPLLDYLDFEDQGPTEEYVELADGTVSDPRRDVDAMRAKLKAEAEESERGARKDPKDAQRRKRHGAAKGAGESVDAGPD